MDASARTPPASTFQELVLRLMTFWAERGCLLTQPFDAEKGAGTYNPNTFLRALGPEPWRAAYVEPSRRPTDGRYGENPNRLYRHHQFQVVLKPSPPDLQGLYLESLRAIGIHPEEHDIRFVEDNWESPTLGAWGLGWEVWVDGMEATQFTYFQQCGGLECRPVTGELTYGLERLAMYLQDVDDVYQLAYAPGVDYGQVFHQDEVEYSKLSFEALDTQLYLELYDRMERETERLVKQGLAVPAYDHLLHAAHAFNALDAKGAISVTERQGYILRIRDLARATAEAYLEVRERLGFPLGRADEAPAPGVAPTGSPEAASAGAGALFVELGTEELPAGEVGPAAEALKTGLVSALEELRLEHGPVEVFSTPRRIAVRIADVEGRQPDRTLEVSGPPVKAAFKEGRPTKAAEGFAKGQGVRVEDLERRETPKGEYLFAVVHEAGRTAAELLPGAVEGALAGIGFSRRMRWGAGEDTFSRPVQWLVASHAGRVLPASFCGVAAGRHSRGHRFLAPEPFDVVDDPFAYEERLEARKVMVDPARRRGLILEEGRRLARSVGGRLMEAEALLDEIVQLVEWPVPLLGEFDPRFLEVPKEVLVSEMVEHQRYVPVLREGGDGLAPRFVVVANTEVEDPARSLAGYRRVLTARFSDGAFFFREDQKVPLFDRLEALESVRFHRKLGSVRAKVERFTALAFEIAGRLADEVEGLEPRPAGVEPYALAAGAPAAEAWALARSCYLSKADLTTQMVFEFPELQGLMGAEYARLGGEPEAVASAIAEHYRPRGAEDDLPEGVLGAVVGLADRFDTIAGIFAANGKGPSGAADPFGLRRAALGILRVLRARRWRLSLAGLIRFALASVVEATGEAAPDPLAADIEGFFRARLKASLTAEGIPTDVAEAALSAGFDDVVEATDRARALHRFRERAEFDALAVTFKRVENILKDASTEPPDVAALHEPVEHRLYEAATTAAREVRARLEAEDHDGAFVEVAELRPAVDAFFEGVMVMAEDPEVRARRQGLLGMVRRAFAPLAAFDKLS